MGFFLAIVRDSLGARRDMRDELGLDAIVEVLCTIDRRTAPESVCLACSRVATAIQIKHLKRGSGCLGVDRLVELMETVATRLSRQSRGAILRVHETCSVPHMFEDAYMDHDWQRWNTFCAICRRVGVEAAPR